MRILIAVLIGGFATPTVAETLSFPVPVPPECAQLAEREHVPVIIENKYQVARAGYKLARLSNAEPMVAQCKQAVDRLKARSKG